MFCTQLTKAYGAKMSCNQLLVDSVTYDIDNIAMSLYDIIRGQRLGNGGDKMRMDLEGEEIQRRKAPL